MSDFPSGMASGRRPLLFPWAQQRGPASKGSFSQRKAGRRRYDFPLSGSLSL